MIMLISSMVTWVDKTCKLFPMYFPKANQIRDKDLGAPVDIYSLMAME